ncbi:MAG: hypothetical protein LBC03_07420, partial [Nitrososphaerota archaeon]|nr:hypothetical protein [Nitrososphaerota archaeon]
EYTILSFPNGALPDYIGDRVGAIGNIGGIIAYGAKIDFQVETMTVTLTEVWNPMIPTISYHRVDGISGWSGTRTLTIPAHNNEAPNQTEPTPSPTSTSDQPSQTDQPPQPEMTIAGFSLLEISLLIILCTTLPVLIIALIYTRKTVRHKQKTQTQT